MAESRGCLARFVAAAEADQSSQAQRLPLFAQAASRIAALMFGGDGEDRGVVAAGDGLLSALEQP